MNELEEMMNTILERKQNPEEGSYTTYLMEKGLEKILKKVGEESTEVVIAALRENKEDVVNEVNDLLYHVLVLLAYQNISLDEIVEEIKKRNQKTHNLKKERRPIEQY